MKPVFEYIDYRRFLGDYYSEMKETTRHFSTRYFANKAGIKSPNFLKRVIDGKRDLTASACEKFIKALGFADKEATYFRHLVGFNQAATSDTKQEHYAVMISLMNSIKQFRLTADQYAFYEQWYVSAIRELACMMHFRDDYKLLAQTVFPPIKASKAKAAIKLLLRLKMLEKAKDGTYCQTSKAIRTSSTVRSMALREFYFQMLDRAKESIDSVNRDERNLSGLTVGLSPAGYDIIVAEIEAFKDRLASIVARDKNSNRVYQISLNVFPLSNEIDSGQQTEEDAQ